MTAPRYRGKDPDIAPWAAQVERQLDDLNQRLARANLRDALQYVQAVSTALLPAPPPDGAALAVVGRRLLYAQGGVWRRADNGMEYVDGSDWQIDTALDAVVGESVLSLSTPGPMTLTGIVHQAGAGTTATVQIRVDGVSVAEVDVTSSLAIATVSCIIPTGSLFSMAVTAAAGTGVINLTLKGSY